MNRGVEAAVRGILQIVLGLHILLGGHAVDGEGAGVEHLQLAALQLGQQLLDLLGGALGGHVLVQLGQLNGALGHAQGDVGREALALHDGLDGHLHVGRPVDAGGDQRGVGGHGAEGDVVADVRHAVVLAGGGGADGVGVLAHQHAALGGDQRGGGFLLQRLVAPAVGELHDHRGGGAGVADAQEGGGIAADDLGVGERAHIADHGLILGDLALLDHLVQLQAGGVARGEAALIDGGEGVVEVVQARALALGAGGVGELDLRELRGGLDDVVLMAEGIGEDVLAAHVRQVGGGVVGFLALGDVGLDDQLGLGIHAQVLHGLLHAVDEVGVIAHVLVVQADQANLHVFLRHFRESDGAEQHGQNQEDGCDFLHNQCLLLYSPLRGVCAVIIHKQSYN